jgi:hypothetical protein
MCCLCSTAKEAKVAIFCEKGFPYFISPVSVQPELIYDALKKCGIEAELVNAKQLSNESEFNATLFSALIYVYGNTFPLSAFDNLRLFHSQEGSFIFIGGAPFTHPCLKEGSKWVDVINQMGSQFYADEKLGTAGVEQVIYPEGFVYFKNSDIIGFGNYRWENIPNISVVQYPVPNNPKDELIGIVGVKKDGSIKGYPFAVIKHNCDDFKGAIDIWLGVNLLALLPEDYIYQIIVKSTSFILKEKGLINEEIYKTYVKKAEEIFPTYAKINKQRRSYNPWLPRSKPLERNLFVLDIGTLSQSEQLLAVSLQGIVNRKKPRIYLLSNYYDWKWLELLRDKGHKIFYVNSVWELLKKFQKEVKGLVIYDPEFPDTINIATMISAVKEAVIASPSTASRLKTFPIIEDLRNRFKSRIEAYEWAYQTLWSDLNPSLIAIMHPSWVFPRDYIIEFKAFTFWIEGEANCWFPPEDISFLKKLLASTPLHTPVLGWWDAGGSGIGESTGVMFSSKYGKVTVATALCPNLSVHSGVKMPQHLQQRSFKEVEVEPKVYLSFLLSDGDNFGANLSGVIKSKWDQKERGEIPMGWPFCPTQVELTPLAVEYFYSTATSNDYFLSADGIGYVWADFYGQNYENPRGIYKEFLLLSKKYMKLLSHNQFWILQGGGKIQEAADVLEPSAIYAEWTPSPSGETSRLSYIGKEKRYFVYWPITHPWEGWPGEAFKNPKSYADKIKNSIPKERPAFLVSAVNGFSVGPREVKEITEELGEDFIVVRPDLLTSLYNKWLEEGCVIREDKGNVDIDGWYTDPYGTLWVKKILNLSSIKDFEKFSKAEISILVKGKRGQIIKILINGREYSCRLKGITPWEWVTVRVESSVLRKGMNEICYTGNPFARLYTAGDSSINRGYSFYQGHNGEWYPLNGELIARIKLLRK